MKNVNITLSDTNYTEQAKTVMALNTEEFELLKKLVQKVEGGLFEQQSAYLGIEGLLKDPVKLTITEFEKSF
jgi:hypothetical protein